MYLFMQKLGNSEVKSCNHVKNIFIDNSSLFTSLCKLSTLCTAIQLWKIRLYYQHSIKRIHNEFL